MLVLGLDPGSVNCGYGLIRADGPHLLYLECGVLHAPESRGKYERLAVLGRDVQQLIREKEPEVVAIEGGFVAAVKGFMMQGILVSAAARGVCGAVAARHGLEVFEYSPSTVKKHACGNGRAEKSEVAGAVVRLLGLACVPAKDATDALAVAITHARQVLKAKTTGRAA